MSGLPSKILIVDDDPTVAQGLEEPLTRHKISLVKASSLENALYYFNQQRFEVVLVELEFGPLPGLALIQKWRQHEVEEKRATAFVLMSGMQRTMGDEGLLKELGDMDMLTKPFTVFQLLPLLSRALARKHTNIKYEELKVNVNKVFNATHDVDKAVAPLKRSIPELGTKGVVLLTDIYEKAGRYEDGLPLVSGLLEQNPSDIALMNSKGRLLLKLGRIEEARQELEKADAMAPYNIERINEMAMLYLKMKEPKMSIERMRDLIKLNPENPDLKFDMFAKLHEHGFSDHAQAFCKETTAPQEVVRHYNNKGVLLSKGGKLEEAITEYERALTYFPNYKENYRIYYNIALARIMQKTPQSLELANKALHKCLEMAPTFEKGQKTLGTLKKLLGTH